MYTDLQDIEGRKSADYKQRNCIMYYEVASTIFTEFSSFNVQQLFHRNNRVRVLHKFSLRVELSTWIMLVSFLRTEVHPPRFFFPSLFLPSPSPDILTVDRKQNANYRDKGWNGLDYRSLIGHSTRACHF